MRSFALLRISRYGSRVFNPLLVSTICVRNSSTHVSLHKLLTSRPPNIIYDYLSPTPSHLLNISLADFLPKSCYPSNFTSPSFALPLARPDALDDSVRSALPQGHHLVYFSPQIPASALLPDGTDPLQSPGPPHVRRMWAGGSLLFNTAQNRCLQLDNRRAVCIERITDVSFKGIEGDEKLFVNITRHIGLVDPKQSDPMRIENEGIIDDQRLLHRYPLQQEDGLGQASVVEVRNIVFMREKSTAAALEDLARPGKILKPAHQPDFSVLIVPTQSLLFRFSALTFNAHAIHLDPQYCHDVEGHRDLLLHGPLSLVLMLSVLRSQLKGGLVVEKFDYRNLAPLYANEELRVCIRKDRERIDRYDVWIEGNGGGYAVRGTAVVGQTIQGSGP